MKTDVEPPPSPLQEPAPPSSGPEAPAKRSTSVRIALLGLVAVGIAAGLIFLPLKQYLLEFLAWVPTTGAWGPVLVAAVYVLACVFFVPGSVLTLGAGFLFGILWGTIAVSAGSTLGAMLAFLVGRTLARDWIEKRIAAYPRFRAIDRAVGRQGFKIVLLVRLSPVFPFNLLNYAFGLTEVRASQYFLASWLGMLPGTLMFVYFGSALKSLAEVAAGTVEATTAQTAFFVLGLVMTVIATVVITRVAKRALDEAVVAEDNPGANAGEGDV